MLNTTPRELPGLYWARADWFKLFFPEARASRDSIELYSDVSVYNTL